MIGLSVKSQRRAETMMNTRKFGGGTHFPIISERRQGSVILVSIRLPKGGLRCTNTSDKGGVIYG